MRKTINEKLQIIKEATTKKKIKMLSLKHGVSVKTIRTWLKQSKPEVCISGKDSINKGDIKESPVLNSRPFSCIVLKISGITVPAKINGGVKIFRYLIKDRNYGFVFAAYSLENNRSRIDTFAETVVRELKKTGYSVEKILTDKTVQLCDLKNVEHCVRSYSELKRHFIFSRKKNNYIKDRQKYESWSDFIFDSLSTVCKINEQNSCLNSVSGKKIITVLKSLNFKLHNDSMCM
ncbi:MAG TPA: hypothetical protein PLK90_07010 [Clostridiales bacterium]|nr:hypothetical protein [Clostridiales bacterium]HQP70133.1 hypothetical protein [Clostridiales bacterium]